MKNVSFDDCSNYQFVELMFVTVCLAITQIAAEYFEVIKIRVVPLIWLKWDSRNTNKK
jgi:hypothetical protein